MGCQKDEIMIETAEQLYQAIEQMGRMQRILESYRNEILTKNPRNFALLAKARWNNSDNCKRRLMSLSTGWNPPKAPQALDEGQPSRPFGKTGQAQHRTGFQAAEG